MSAIIPSSGGMIPRQGVAKEKIVDIRVLSVDMAYDNWADMLENDINEYLKSGFQPMPNSYSVAERSASIVMIKTKMEVEMI